MKWAIGIVVVAVAVASCGAGPDPDSAPPSPAGIAADEFAFSARRALVDTRFEGLGDRWLAESILGLCEGLAGGGDPDALVAAVVAGADAAAGPPVDDEILAEVLTVGVAEVCPAAVLSAHGLDPSGESAVAFLAVVTPVVEQAGLRGALDAATLLDAGVTACVELDEGATPDVAAARVLATLFLVDADDLAGLEEAGLGPREGIVGGSVLGAASSVLCPEHADRVADYVSGVNA
jgi:hypothetical protein